MSGKLVDVLKRSFYYGKAQKTPSIKDLPSLLIVTWTTANKLANNIDGDCIGSIMQTNLNKLKARFPDKFKSENAFNRDLDTQRKVLEN